MFGFFEVFSGALATFYSLIPSYGVAIILLTVVVRLLLLPLSIKQTRSMREMQLIQPEVKKIQAKHKGNRQKMNEEMMALYKEHGVNPLGGCLPLVMQIPVFIALFNVIRYPLKYMGFSAGENGAFIGQKVSGVMANLQDSALAKGLHDIPIHVNHFLGIRLDCSASLAAGNKPSDAVPGGSVCGSGFLDALPYIILVAAMGLTMYYQTKQMQGQRGAGQDAQAQQMQLVGRIMPAVFVLLGWSFPSGLVLYWVTSNVWTIGQQRLMLKAAPPLTPGSKADGKAAAKPDSKPSAGGKSSKAPPGKVGDIGEESGKTQSKPHPSSKKKKRR